MRHTVHPSRPAVKCGEARDNGPKADLPRRGGRMSESGQPVSYGEATSKDERNLAMFAHLSAFAGLIFPAGGNVIAPLIVWLTQREKSAFIADQSLEALNFNLTVLLAEIVCAFLLIVGIG